MTAPDAGRGRAPVAPPAPGREVAADLPGAGNAAASLPRVIGLDLSASSTGVALPDGTTYCITAPKAAGKTRILTDDLARLENVYGRMCAILNATHPQLAVIEDYAHGLRANSMTRIAEIQGVVRLACFQARVPVALVNLMHLKIYATGKGGAEKRDMAMAAYKRAGEEFPTDDECDAWWLQAMGLDHLGHAPVALPALHRGALDKVAWPAGVS